MPDLQKLYSDKERIITTIRTKGPSFPARISREVQIAPLFVSAILAELVSEKTLKISNMKVGSSPLYLLPGQEDKLSEFSQYLNHREKEAFSKLKDSQILSDEEQEPTIRVALRSLKDFAIPITVKIKGETKTFWKYFSLQDENAIQLIQKAITPVPIPEISPILATPIIPEVKSEEKLLEKEPELESLELPIETEQKIIETISPLKIKSKKQIESKFANSVKDYLNAKEIELLEEVLVKKKEFISKTRLDTPLGKQEYYTIAKEKKRVTEQDLALALQKAQEEKMPALILAPGEIDKNAKPFFQQWRNLLKFEKISL